MTIKDIEKQVENAKKTREELIKNQSESEEQAKNYRAKADAAAIAGDVAAYKEFKALADDAEAMAYVCGKQLDAENNITLEQTREAWEDYVSDYKRKFAGKLKKFEAAKDEMLKAYADAVVLQGEACEARERLARLCGMPLQVAAVGIDDRLDATYPMDYIPCKSGSMMDNDAVVSIAGSSIKDPDAVYYLASLHLKNMILANDPRQQALAYVVKNHRAFSRD